MKYIKYDNRKMILKSINNINMPIINAKSVKNIWRPIIVFNERKEILLLGL